MKFPTRAVGAALVALSMLCSTWAPQAAAQPGAENAASDVKDGLSINKPGAFSGYSLVAPMNSTSTYLIDMDGRIVHEWKSDYTPALSAYLLENGHLLRPGAEGGFMAGGPGAGGRIQEFDWDGELVWDYSFGDSKLRPHHDICGLPNGNVLVVCSDPKTDEEAIAAGRRPESLRGRLLPECILEIKPTGKTTGEIVWEWHAWDHVVQDFDKEKASFGDVSEHPELIDLNFSTGMMDRMMRDPQQLARLRSLGYVGGGTQAQDRSQAPDGKAGENPPARGRQDGEQARGDRPNRGGPGRDGARPGGPGGPGGGPMQGDWMHVNSIAYNPKLDQVMISVHEFSEVWVIDHSTTKAEAATHQGGRSGKGGDLLYRWGNPRVYRSGSNVDQRLFAQHCAHWIGEGLPGAGHMLVFNNGNGRPDGAYSSVDEVALPVSDKGRYEKEEFLAFAPEHAAWSYTAADKTSFFAMLISGAQRLPNGNTFICSGNQAVLFEVTPKNEIVWQFKYPGGGFGGPGGMRSGELVPSFLAQMLGVTDEQKQSLDKLQAEVDGKLAKLLTEEQRKKRDRPVGFPFGGPPPGGFGGPGGPDGARRGGADRPKGPGNADRPEGRDADRRDGDRPEGRDVARRGPGGPGGPGGFGFFRPPPVGEVISSPLKEQLELTEAQANELKEIQQTVDDQLAKIWTDEQKTQLEEMENMARRRPGGGPPGGFGPRGFGPPGGPRDGDRRQADRGNRRGPPGPGGPGRGPGGIFRCYRYGPDFAGLAGKELKPGKKLDEVAAAALRPAREPADRQPRE